MSDDVIIRLQSLEEKSAHQERMVDALNEVIIDQQAQLSLIKEQFQRFRFLLEAMQEQFPGGQDDPPPPHY